MSESSASENPAIKLESLLYFLAFLLALALRLAWAGRTPLNDGEAAQALQALALAHGEQLHIGAQPGYVLLTSVIFFLFPATTTAARLLPAVIGSLLVWAPMLLKQRVGRRAALVLAFGLALEPGLAAASRMPGSAVLALSFGLLAAVFFYRKQPAAAGIFTALALLGGPGLWMGVLILLLVGLWARIFSAMGSDVAEVEGEALPDNNSAQQDVAGWIAAGRSALPWFAVTLAAVGTMFFTAPAGLSAATSSLVEFVQGWGGASSVTVWRILAALLLYSPLALVFGLIRLVPSWRAQDLLDRILSRWFLIALLVVLAYPARQTTDLIWALVPLWGLAARQLVHVTQVHREETLPLVALIGVQIVLFVFAWYNLVIFSDTFQAGPEYHMRWISVVGAVLLALVVALLAGWGWSRSVATTALKFSLTVVLGIYGLSSAVQAAGLGADPDAELWRNSPQAGQTDLLLQSVHDLSEWNARSHDGLDLFVLDADTPALRWALRDYQHAYFVQTLPADTQPAMVLTPKQELPGFAASYTGQDFNWQVQPDWQGVTADIFLRWLVDRETPTESSQIILWVRTDLMPGGITDNSDLTI